MSQFFRKMEEDFICEQCGRSVAGDGYTNHCPDCLWSKHVDVYPGDRAEQCLGLMRPVNVRLEGGEYILIHKCEDCFLERTNRAAEDDDIAGFLSRLV